MGESIAINGCCLTVVEIAGNCLSFQAGEETLRRTNLGELRVGSSVNMERSLKIGDSLGGHLVQGHIDGTGKILEILKEGEWTTIYFSVPEQFSHYLVSKGSIAVDGVSLTVVDTQPDRFSVALIPHTLQVTTMGTKQKGDVVNLEFDIIAKQIARLAEPILKKLAGVK